MCVGFLFRLDSRSPQRGSRGVSPGEIHWELNPQICTGSLTPPGIIAPLIGPNGHLTIFPATEMYLQAADKYGDPSVFYEDYYARMPCSPGGSRASLAPHEVMERPWTAKDHFGTVLEVGAGKSEHQPFVKHSYDRYIATDIRMPQVGVQSEYTWVLADATRVPMSTESVDRALAT